MSTPPAARPHSVFTPPERGAPYAVAGGPSRVHEIATVGTEAGPRRYDTGALVSFPSDKHERKDPHPMALSYWITADEIDDDTPDPTKTTNPTTSEDDD